MPMKIVIKSVLVGNKCKSKILSVVAKLDGIKSMDIDPEKCTLTVVGDVDPVCLVQRLRKECLAADIVSVEEDKPKPKKTPAEEACEKACKERCEKLCKDACCEKAFMLHHNCEKRCKDACCDDCEKAFTPHHNCEKRCNDACCRGSGYVHPNCQYGYGYGYIR